MFNILKTQSSTHVNKQVVEQYINNPDFPWLISFPRTGSHWLRMLMELYFEQPSLVRIFYYHNAKEYTCYHWHDEDLSCTNIKNVIYLYRYPVDTIYSQMKFHKEDHDDTNRIYYWSKIYGEHLSKWICDEKFTENKIILNYEKLNQGLEEEFKKICVFFNKEFDKNKLLKVSKQVTKKALKKKTVHDPRVVNLSKNYTRTKDEFKITYSNIIMQTIYKINPNIESVFA